MLLSFNFTPDTPDTAMTKRRLTVAQIGCGAFAASQDLPNFRKNPHTRVKWCCDVLPDNARRLAKEFGVANVTTDFMDVMNDPEVDLIKISTSHEVHLPIITTAAARGKHIFCEKPMALEEDEALKIVGAVRRNRVKLCVDLNRRMAPALRRLRARWLAHRRNPKHHPWRYTETERDLFPEEHQAQLLIRVQDDSYSYRLVHLDPLRGGGAIIGETVHWLDLARWMLAPDVPVEIQAFGSRRFSHAVNLRFSGGHTAAIVFHCSGTFDYPKELVEIASDGALFRSLHFVENEYFGVPGLDRDIFPLQNDCMPGVGDGGGFQGYMEKYRQRVKALKNAKEDYRSLSADKGHQAMLNTFVQAILEDRPSPCDELDGYISTVLAKLAIRSLESRQALPVAADQLFPCIAP